MLRIGVDVMTGDIAEKGNLLHNLEAAEKARLELQSQGEVEVVYAGIEREIHRFLSSLHGNSNHNVRIIDAPEIVTMEDKVTSETLRKQSSMKALIDALRQEELQGAFSIGNTGAWCGIATSLRFKGKNKIRPSIGVSYPRYNVEKRGYSLVLDSGFDAQNTDPDFERYLEFMLMGYAYIYSTQRKENPKYGILSYGTEDSKATDNARRANEFFRIAHEQGLLPGKYEGFVEPDSIYFGDIDIILTDGKVGNILLKTAENTAKVLKQTLKDNFNWFDKVLLQLGMAGRIRKGLSPYSTEANSVMPLLGLQAGKTVTIGHGSSSQETFRRGVIRTAELTAQSLQSSFDIDVLLTSVKQSDIWRQWKET